MHNGDLLQSYSIMLPSYLSATAQTDAVRVERLLPNKQQVTRTSLITHMQHTFTYLYSAILLTLR